MNLPDIDRSRFTRKKNKRTRQWYLKMDYEVRVSFDYPRLNYEIVIPQNGRFPDSETWGDDPIRRPAVLNCAAAFEITRPQALETPVRARPGIALAARENAADLASLTTPNLRSAESRTSRKHVDSIGHQKPCRRCRKLGVNCIPKKGFGTCYKCSRAGEDCTIMS